MQTFHNIRYESNPVQHATAYDLPRALTQAAPPDLSRPLADAAATAAATAAAAAAPLLHQRVPQRVGQPRPRLCRPRGGKPEPLLGGGRLGSEAGRVLTVLLQALRGADRVLPRVRRGLLPLLVLRLELLQLRGWWCVVCAGGRGG